nr:MAG TPA: hypothetical protein [Caudoviricetes sp.]
MTLKEIQNNLKQVVVDKFRELNQIRNEIIAECGEWANKKHDEYNFPIGDFSEEVLFIYVLSKEGIKWGILGKPSKTIPLYYFERDYDTLKRWFLRDLRDNYNSRLKSIGQSYHHHREQMKEKSELYDEVEEKLNIIEKVLEDNDDR